MGERARNIYNIYQNKWQAMEPAGRRRVGLGFVALFVAVVVTLFFALRPNWVILESNLAFAVSANIQEALEAENIPFRVSGNFRTIQVREPDIQRAQVLLTTGGLLVPSQGFSLEDAFDNIGMGTAQDTRDQMFRSAQESQIAATLMELDAIQHATVNINPGNPSPIVRTDANRPSASVVLVTSAQIDSGMALSLANTIANSVEGLTIENVHITDQNMRSIFDGSRVGDDRFGSAGDLDPIAAHALLMESNVLNVFSSLFDNVSVAASPSVTRGDIVTQTVVHVPPVDGATTGLVARAELFDEEASGEAGELLPPAGADANAGIFPIGGAGQTTEAMRSSSVVDYVFNTVQQHEVQIAGELVPELSSVSITAYINQIFNEAVLRQQGALDDYGSFQEFSIAHRNNVILTAEQFEGFDQLILLASNATGVPVENVAITIFQRPLFFEEQVTPMNWQGIVLAAILIAFILLLAFGILRGTKREKEVEVEPELSIEDVLVTTKIEVEDEQETQKLQDLAYAVDSEVKQQIDKFVNEKPEAVAQLLRSWLNEGWE
ncbi:MAG: hypothetical protein FWF50_04375 [Defluviitaleaceae bacterium]|nr:hypothetical protein [Defluviitaleaceae bacterium]